MRYKKLFKKYNDFGLTLVELLAVMVIIGILAGLAIPGVSHLINKSRKEQRIQQEETVSMAAKNYVQDNKSLRPRQIGELTVIHINDLKSANYLKEDVLDSSGQSCMKSSYVVVSKSSKTNYKYKTYLCCGKETCDDYKKDLVEPTIQLYFTDSSGEETNDVFNNVSAARIHIELTGGEFNGKVVPLAGYSWTLSAKYKGEDKFREVYNSGTLNAGNAKAVSINNGKGTKEKPFVVEK